MSTPAACPHRPPCPGCPRYGDPDIAPAARDWLASLARAAGLPAPTVHRAPALGHRHRARLAVRGSAHWPRLGLFEAGSHRVVAIPDCGVHHPAINAAAAALCTAIREVGIAPYDDARHDGTLRYVQLVVERASERVQIVLVGRGESPECLGELPRAVEERLGDRMNGLFFSAQPARTNAILGPSAVRLAGSPAVRERLGGVDVFFPPTAFGQSHLPLFARAVERIHALVPDAAHVAELYCGVGAIGLGLLARAAQIDFNERAAGGLEGLALGLEERPAEERARARRHPGSAGEHAALASAADVALVDPPRRGLDAPLLAQLAEHPPRRLVYLACDRTSLARDLAGLQANGRLHLAGLEAFDFFPFTEHVETLAWLDRVG